MIYRFTWEKISRLSLAEILPWKKERERAFYFSSSPSLSLFLWTAPLG